MKRKGAALRRALAWAGMGLASWMGAVTTAAAQYEVPGLLMEPPAAQPIGYDYAPPTIAPAGYYGKNGAPSQVAVDPAAPAPYEPYAPGTPIAAAPCVAAPCASAPCGQACGSCGGCGGCNCSDSSADCGGCGSCDSCCSCRPCFAGPRCMDPWYIALSGGWAHRNTVHEADDPQTFIEFAEGFALNGALGYRFSLFRVETEFSFMNHECDTAGAGPAIRAGIPASPATGNVNLRAYMLNVYHDIDLAFTAWRPYLGAGLGFYQSELNSLYPDFFANPGLAPFGFNTNPVNSTSDIPFAYQFRAGGSLPLGERTELFVGYRYFKGEELTFASAPFAGPAAPTFHPDGAEVHSVESGLRIRF